MQETMTDEKRDELRRLAEFAKEHVRKGMCSRDEVDRLARGVLMLLDSAPLTDAEAHAIQAVSEVEQLKRRVAQLEAALSPFAHFAQRFNATPMRGISDTLYAIHGGLPDKEAELRLSDCRRVLEMLGPNAPRVFTEAEVREAVVRTKAKREAVYEETWNDVDMDSAEPYADGFVTGADDVLVELLALVHKAA